MFLKALFVTTAILVSCSAPPPENTPSEDEEKLSSEKENPSNEKITNWDSSREYFHYILTDCTGEQHELYDQKRINGFIDISIEDGEVHISRPQHPSSNVGLEGEWNPSNGQLTNISGHFGVGRTEDWDLASGFLYISNDEIVGNINGIQLRYVGSNVRGKIDVACSLSLTIEKKKH